MGKSLFLYLLLAMFAGIALAQARPTGDMFDDMYYTSADRPYIAGDRPRSADFFPTSQPYMRTNKDMFDHVRSDPGIADMFPSPTARAPDEKLFNWPQDQPRP